MAAAGRMGRVARIPAAAVAVAQVARPPWVGMEAEPRAALVVRRTAAPRQGEMGRRGGRPLVRALVDRAAHLQPRRLVVREVSGVVLGVVVDVSRARSRWAARARVASSSLRGFPNG